MDMSFPPSRILDISAILECWLVRLFAKMVGAWRRALCPIQQAQCRRCLLRWYYEPLWPIQVLLGQRRPSLFLFWGGALTLCSLVDVFRNSAESDWHIGGLGTFSGPAGAFIAESQNMIYICDLHMHPRAQMYMFAYTFTYIHVHFVYIYACTYIHILDACMY